MQCVFCLSNRVKERYPVTSVISGKTVIYFRCRDCGSLMQRPLPDPESIAAYYASYFSVKRTMNPGYLDDSQYAGLKRERDMTLREIGFPAARIASGRNVELGCANGHFLRYLIENGSLSTTGIDISEELLDAVNLPHASLIRGSLKDIPARTAENLYLFNIMEHVADIHGLFEDILRVTIEDSLVVIEIPLAGAVSSFHGVRWRFLMPDEHLNIPSMKGFRHILHRYGLEIAGSTRFGSGLTEGTASPRLKRFADRLVKRTGTGDRGSFLVRRISSGLG